MSEKKQMILAAAVCIIALGLFFYFPPFENDGHYEVRWVTYTVAKKYVEQEATNMRGGFETVHYLYMTNGTLKEVKLLDYVSAEPGKQISFAEEVWVKDKKQ